MAEEKNIPDLKKIILALLSAGYELSKREVEIFMLLAAGKTDREIAVLLYIAPSTARTHHENIFKKLKVHKKSELAQLAKRLAMGARIPPFSEN